MTDTTAELRCDQADAMNDTRLLTDDEAAAVGGGYGDYDCLELFINLVRKIQR